MPFRFDKRTFRLRPASAESAHLPYGERRRFLQTAAAVSAAALCGTALEIGKAVSAAPLKLIAFGDSLSAGYELPADAAFPAVLEKALRAQGLDVSVLNAGVSGDTTAGGLARLDWTLQDGADGLILELGANDMLRGVDPQATKATLAKIIASVQARNIKVFLAGMLAAPSLGPEYKAAFDAIYPALAAQYNVPLYPFFLNGVAGDPGLELADRLHPNRAGVERIVQSILPAITAFAKSLPARG
jgi:acyl-CoA thioesterase-1